MNNNEKDKVFDLMLHGEVRTTLKDTVRLPLRRQLVLEAIRLYLPAAYQNPS